jgi:predicted permease
MQNLLRTLHVLFQGKRHYQDLDEEMRLHMELRARKLAASGLNPDDATHAARRGFGSIARLQEDCRRSWSGLRFLDELRQDFVYAARTLRRDWLFSATAIITLTLGIAANTAVFAFIDALILRPLPVPDPQRLVQLSSRDLTTRSETPAFCFPIFEGVAQRAKSFQGLFTWNSTQFSIGQGADAETVAAGVASGEAFRTLGIRAQAGRLFGPSDDTSSASPVTVVSDSFWNRNYGHSSSMLGRRIFLDRHPFTIIGVLPRDFTGIMTGQVVDIVIPFHTNAALHPQWDMLHTTRIWWMNIFGRRRDRVSQAAALAEVQALSRPVLQSLGITEVSGNPLSKTTFALASAAQGGREAIARYDQPLYFLISVALAVLLIGCLNVANLLLARTVSREREISVRMTLGASRFRVIRHMVTESLLLSGAGTILGAALAIWVSRAAAHFLVGGVEITPDLRLIGFVGGLATLVTVLFGLLPPFAVPDPKPINPLRWPLSWRVSGAVLNVPY